MNNIILRSKESELYFIGPDDEFNLTKLIPRFDGIEQIKNKYQQIDNINENALNMYVIELIDNKRTLTIFKRVRWDSNNSLNWKRCNHLIWTINS
jgi:hypothetical protein